MNIRDLVTRDPQGGKHRPRKAASALDHSHRQLLHLTSTQLDRILVSNAPNNLTNQIVINLPPGLGFRVAGYIPSILDRSFQIRVKPFGHLVNELFGTTQSGRLSDLGFIVCVSGVPECNVVSDLLCTKADVSDLDQPAVWCIRLRQLTVNGKCV